MEIGSAGKKESVVITAETAPSTEVKKLLAETIYGLKGKLQYRHNDSSERIASVTHPLFVTIRKKNKLLATAGFLYRRSSCGNKMLNSWYIRFLSINTSNYLKENGRRSIGANQRKYKSGKGIIKSAVTELINAVSSRNQGPAVFYAIVEKDNEYSQNLCSSFEFEKVREVKTFFFGRLSPKIKAEARRIVEEEKPVILACLRKTYSGFNFWFEDHLFLNSDYFVYEENNQIVAGIKAMVVSWEIVSIPGFSGFIIQKLLPRLPYLNKIVNAKKLKFIAFEAPFVNEGREAVLFDLMESICSELKGNIGMMWMDEDSPFFDRIKDKGSWGFISKLQDPVPTNLLVKFIHIGEKEKEIYKNFPAYISAFDCT